MFMLQIGVNWLQYWPYRTEFIRNTDRYYTNMKMTKILSKYRPCALVALLLYNLQDRITRNFYGLHKGQLISKSTLRLFPSYHLLTLLLYFLFIFYLPRYTPLDFPSVSSQASLSFLSCH